MPLVLIFIVEAIPELFSAPRILIHVACLRPLRACNIGGLCVPLASAWRTKIREKTRIRAASCRLSTDGDGRETDLRRSTSASAAGGVHPVPAGHLEIQDPHEQRPLSPAVGAGIVRAPGGEAH